MSDTEAIIWSYGILQRVEPKTVCEHFNCPDVTQLYVTYYKDPDTFKHKISKLLNFELSEFDRTIKLEDI